MPGVKIITVSTFIPGYVQDPEDRVFVTMVDADVGRVFDDWGITQERWDAVQKDRAGIVMSRMQSDLWHESGRYLHHHRSPGHPGQRRQKLDFKVVAICNDFPQALGRYEFWRL